MDARTVSPICLHLGCMPHLHAANVMYFIFFALDEWALVDLLGDRSRQEVGYLIFDPALSPRGLAKGTRSECESNICNSAWYRRPLEFSISRNRDDEGPQGLPQSVMPQCWAPTKSELFNTCQAHEAHFPMLGAIEYWGLASEAELDRHNSGLRRNSQTAGGYG